MYTYCSPTIPTATVLAMLIAFSMAKSAGIYVITPDNQQSIVGLSFFSIYSRNYDSDWIFLYFNSTNPRQQSTFEYLIPGIAKQLAYVTQSKKQNAFVYPPIGIIDCYTCGSLCSGVGYNDLPLLLYKQKYKSAIRYRGYVTLSGMISFVKTHDPATSYMAEQYKPEGQPINDQDMPKKQIRKIMNKIMEATKIINTSESKDSSDSSKNGSTNNQRQSQQKPLDQPKQEILLLSEPQADGKNITDEPIIESSKYESKLQTQDKKIVQDKMTNQEQTSKVEQKQVNYKNQAQKDKVESPKKKKSEKKDKKSKQKKGQKKQSNKFLQSVDYMSGLVVSAFSSIGFGGVVLEIVGWVSYVIFFLVIGVLWIVLQAA